MTRSGRSYALLVDGTTMTIRPAAPGAYLPQVAELDLNPVIARVVLRWNAAHRHLV